MTELRFIVPGEPVPKARARVRVIAPRGGSRPFVQSYTPAKTRAYEDRVRLVAQSAAAQARWTFDKGEHMTLTCTVHRTYAEKGGDWDNYVKCVQDACNGVLWVDDRYVRGGGGFIALQPCPENPRIEVTVRKI